MSENRCLFCTEIIPEGLQVYPNCEEKLRHKATDFTEAVKAATDAVVSLAKNLQAHLRGAQELKILPEYYEAVKTGKKPFEIRSIKDRTFAANDILKLREFDGSSYTGRCLFVYVTYVFVGGQYGIDPDYAVLGIKCLGSAKDENR